jgi:hypothetical protein
LAEVREVAQLDPERLTHLIQYQHPNSTPAATGTLISIERLIAIREEVTADMEKWTNRIVGSSSAAYDSSLGTSLHSSLKIVPADAASEEVWNFLSLMIFPDLLYQRFPNLSDERSLGTPRNTLRRVWLRREILGDLLLAGSPILGEDELVGLFERTAFARNRRLVRVVAEAVLNYEGTAARSEFARMLYKRVLMSTGPFFWDVVSTDELRRNIEKTARQVFFQMHPQGMTDDSIT